MTPAVKYTLGRLGLFVLVAVALLPVGLNLYLTLMVALLVSMALSYVLLRRWRDELAAQIGEAARQRQERKNQLRAALAGEDQPATGDRLTGEDQRTGRDRDLGSE